MDTYEKTMSDTAMGIAHDRLDPITRALSQAYEDGHISEYEFFSRLDAEHDRVLREILLGLGQMRSNSDGNDNNGCANFHSNFTTTYLCKFSLRRC